MFDLKNSRQRVQTAIAWFIREIACIFSPVSNLQIFCNFDRLWAAREGGKEKWR